MYFSKVCSFFHNLLPSQRRRGSAEPGDERVLPLLADVIPGAGQTLLEVRGELEMALRFLRRRAFATSLLFRILR